MFHTCLYLGSHSHLDSENQFKEFVPGLLVKWGYTSLVFSLKPILIDPHSRLYCT